MRKQIDQNRIRSFQSQLLTWYASHKRDLPWRKTRDPYKILVSEIMLQQTQVDRVIPKYHAFLREFSTVRTLARATPAAVIRAWRGLGYNRRALYLQKAAHTIVHEHGGRFPRDVQALELLPGVGPYTARAVACFAYKHEIGFVDTNVARVLHRVFYGSDVPRRRVHEKVLWDLARRVVPKGKADLWHHALMDFGALVCTARRPTCATSPLKDFFPACGKIAMIDWKKVMPRTKRIPFRETDRFFRGRIIDYLREAPRHRAPVAALEFHFRTLCPPSRLQELLTALLRDGLVIKVRAVIALPV